jgi:hypothetical protein
LPPQCGGEQRGQELDRLCLLGNGEQLDPHRAEADLTAINCLGRSGTTSPPPRSAS